MLERKLALAWMCGRGGAHHAPTEDSALRYTVRMAVAGQLQDTCVESGLCGSWSWGKALGERGWHVAGGSGVVSVVTNAGVFSLSDTVGASLGAMGRVGGAAWEQATAFAVVCASELCGGPTHALSVEVSDVMPDGTPRMRVAAVVLTDAEMELSMQQVLGCRLGLAGDWAELSVTTGIKVETAEVWQRWALGRVWRHMGTRSVLVVDVRYEGSAGDDVLLNFAVASGLGAVVDSDMQGGGSDAPMTLAWTISQL